MSTIFFYFYQINLFNTKERSIKNARHISKSSKIRDYFESKGISLVSVATYFDIPRQDLIDYLNGKIKVKSTRNTFGNYRLLQNQIGGMKMENFLDTSSKTFYTTLLKNPEKNV